MNLILNDIELFLISFRSDLAEILGDFSFTESNNSFVLEICTKGHFDESFIRGYIQDKIIVIKLSLEKFISTLIV